GDVPRYDTSDVRRARPRRRSPRRHGRAAKQRFRRGLPQISTADCPGQRGGSQHGHERDRRFPRTASGDVRLADGTLAHRNGGGVSAKRGVEAEVLGSELRVTGGTDGDAAVPRLYGYIFHKPIDLVNDLHIYSRTCGGADGWPTLSDFFLYPSQPRG